MRDMVMELVRAFLVGGAICALVQILLDRTKMMPGRVMVTLVVTGNVLGWLGLYEPFLKWAGAGAGVPLLGFGNTLWKGVAKAVGEEGLWESLKAASPLPPPESQQRWCLGIWGRWCLSRR